MQTDTNAIAGIWHWLLVPFSGAQNHQIAAALAWHGRFMVLAWGLLLPVMVVIARYYKIVPGQDWPRYLDNPFWFITHRRAGYWIAVLATCAMVAVAWNNQAMRPLGSMHGVVGWSLFLLGWLQVIGSRARGSMAVRSIRLRARQGLPSNGPVIISA